MLPRNRPRQSQASNFRHRNSRNNLYCAVGRYIAHKVTGTRLIRAVYEYSEVLPALVTVYYPHAQRYFQGGILYEDKILK
ncbi:MAG: hypothetical protein D4R88_08040 [Methanosarcinales archaeon]|nr:MAG: hypothetical protein D4R88_08040 [Methanosarcinales archaeon]